MLLKTCPEEPLTEFIMWQLLGPKSQEQMKKLMLLASLFFVMPDRKQGAERKFLQSSGLGRQKIMADINLVCSVACQA